MAIAIISFLPVFRFYASLRPASSLQGNVAPGANEPITAPMPRFAQTLNHKPPMNKTFFQVAFEAFSFFMGKRVPCPENWLYPKLN